MPCDRKHRASVILAACVPALALPWPVAAWEPLPGTVEAEEELPELVDAEEELPWRVEAGAELPWLVEAGEDDPQAAKIRQSPRAVDAIRRRVMSRE
jgi:hypothetical protein